MVSTVRRRRSAYRAGRLLAGAALLAGTAGGCSLGLGGHSSSPTTTSPPTSTTVPVTSTTAPAGPQTSGPRTVLSPIGLNVRRWPTVKARVLGAAAQGTVFTVLGYTRAHGGWFKVKGATVTGWITAQPTLSARGQFHYYSSAAFNALYPATWTASHPAASSIAFRPRTGAGDIVVTAAHSVTQLPNGRSGYNPKGASQVLACGITAELLLFQRAGTSATTSSATSVPESLAYLAEVRFAVGKHHALGLYADMPDLGPAFQIFKEFVAAVTFSAPICIG